MQILDIIQIKQKYVRHSNAQARKVNPLVDRYNGLYKEEYFCEILSLERKRSERSRQPFLLMIADLQEFDDGFERNLIAKQISEIISSVTRETDVKGWYRNDVIIGVIFVEIPDSERNLKSAQNLIMDKCINALEARLDINELDRVSLTWHSFPGQFDDVFSEESTDRKVYPDIAANIARKSLALFVKRIIDILGSLTALTLFFPLYLIIALLIKITSKGPVHFKQERVGLFGKRFVFLKFRSMFIGNDPTVHKEFVKNLIHDNEHLCNTVTAGNTNGTYKITRDPRVTPIGHFLRKTSLDELPQFWNVLKGDMSIVGPRPPIPYEYEEYDIWHRKRLLGMKPGITGLWQVKGRSTTTFNNMVRMDIQYVQEWSLWLDFKILFQTPLVVILGKGAY